MLNLRQIDGKFFISGGWTDVPKDAEWLERTGFNGVLDLQFSKIDYNPQSVAIIEEALRTRNLDYRAIGMNDGENDNLAKIFADAYEILDTWDKLYIKPFSRILVKCGVGVSRSVAVLAYYYCKRDGISYKEALARIRRADNYETGLPVSIDNSLERFLREVFPDDKETVFA